MKKAVWFVVMALAIIVGYALFRTSTSDPVADLYRLKPYKVIPGPHPEQAPDKKVRTFYFQGKAAYESLDELKRSLLGRKDWYLRSSDDNYAFFSNTKLAGQGSEIDWYLTDDTTGKAVVHVVQDASGLKMRLGRLTVSAGPKSGLPPIKISPKDRYDAQLGIAAQNDDVASATDAIKHGAHVGPISKDELGPLYWAVTGKGMHVAELLVRKGADVNASDSFGGSIVSQMARDGHPDAVRFLVKHGAKIDKKDDLFQVANAMNPVDAFIDWPEDAFFDEGWRTDDGWKYSGESAQALIDAGAKVNATDSDGNTPVYKAALNGNAFLVAVLLKNGATLPRVDKFEAIVKKRHRNAWRKVLQLIENSKVASVNGKR